VIAIEAGKVADLGFGDLIAFVIRLFFMRLKKRVPSINCTLPRRSGGLRFVTSQT
jgi:hypothetical protein